MPTINDYLLQRVAKTGRMLAGCALSWPDEVLAATQNLPLDCFTDPQAQRFVAALRADPDFLPDNRLDEKTLEIWLADAMLSIPIGEELDISSLAARLKEDWAAIKSIERLQREQRTQQRGGEAWF